VDAAIRPAIHPGGRGRSAGGSTGADAAESPAGPGAAPERRFGFSPLRVTTDPTILCRPVLRARGARRPAPGQDPVNASPEPTSSSDGWRALRVRLRRLHLLQLAVIVMVSVALGAVATASLVAIDRAFGRQDEAVAMVRALDGLADELDAVGVQALDAGVDAVPPPETVDRFLAAAGALAGLARSDTAVTPGEEVVRERVTAGLQERARVVEDARPARGAEIVVPEELLGDLDAWQRGNRLSVDAARDDIRSVIDRALVAFAVALAALIVAVAVIWTRIERSRLDTVASVEATERRFGSLVERSSDVVLVVDGTGALDYVSPAGSRLFGVEGRRLIGTPLAELVHIEDADAATRLVRRAGTPAPEGPAVLRLKGEAGWRHLEIVVSDLRDDPAVGGVVLNGRDVTERTRMEAYLTHQALHDGLTGLANRALFGDRVAQVIAAGGPGRMGVMLIDLDDFKTVNDSLGHGTGNLILHETARRVSAAVRPGDTVARLGGDEFAVLLPSVDDEVDAELVAHRILDAVAEPMRVGSRDLTIRGSLGIVVEAVERADPHELLRAADIAMYAAKTGPRGGYRLFDPGMRERTELRMALQADLEHAVDRGELFVEYQPIVSLETRAVVGVEALARWRHPRRGIVPPDEFIPLAEQSGAIIRVGDWVLRRACADAAGWLRTAPDLLVSVNVSPYQLERDDLPERVRGALLDAGIPAASLALELTEGVLMGDPDASVRRLEALHHLGVRLAIDDFGTGYSSLAYLARLPVDIVKIDRSFVSGVGDRDREVDVAAMVVQFVGGLHLRTVAEGVETPEQAEDLRRLGCGAAQGFLYSRPLPAEQVTGFLAGGPRVDRVHTAGD
jgi:diguanylate cyclase (GGDEF)-like protein/PAS domain S-box-containing protein